MVSFALSNEMGEIKSECKTIETYKDCAKWVLHENMRNGCLDGDTKQKTK